MKKPFPPLSCLGYGVCHTGRKETRTLSENQNDKGQPVPKHSPTATSDNETLGQALKDMHEAVSGSQSGRGFPGWRHFNSENELLFETGPSWLELMILLPSPPCVLPCLGLSNGWDFALLFL